MAFSMKMGKLSMDNTPIYQVDTEKGVMGQALNNGSILIDKHLSGKDKEEVIKHEKVHLDQMSRGDLDYDGDNVYWKGKKYPRSVMNEGAKNLPWEKEAYSKTKDMKNSTKNTPFYKTGPSDPSPKEKQSKAKVGEIPGLQEIKQRFKGKYEVTAKKGQVNKYKLVDKSGNSISYSAGPRSKKEKRTFAEAINESMK